MTLQSKIYLLNFSLSSKKSATTFADSFKELESQILTTSHLFDDFISFLLVKNNYKKIARKKVAVSIFFEPVAKYFSPIKIKTTSLSFSKIYILTSEELLTWTMGLLSKYFNLLKTSSSHLFINLEKTSKFLIISYVLTKPKLSTKKSLNDFYIYSFSEICKILQINCQIKNGHQQLSIVLKVKNDPQFLIV